MVVVNVRVILFLLQRQSFEDSLCNVWIRCNLNFMITSKKNNSREKSYS